MASVRLYGNYRKAAMWVPVGYQKLYQMKEQMQRLGLQICSEVHKFNLKTPEDDVIIEISSNTFLNFKDPIQLRMAKYNDASVDVIKITCGHPVGLYAFIVAHVGSTTINYVRRYYDLKGQELDAMPHPMIDDGRYFVNFVGVSSEDPWTYKYGPVTDKDGNVYQPEGINEIFSSNHKNIEFGLGIPECPSGQDIKKPSLISHARFMLNQAAENEAFGGVTVTCYNGDSYKYCVPLSSLGQFPYALTNQQTPFMNRYTSLGILSTHAYLRDLGGVTGIDAVSCETFADLIYSVSRLYHTGFGRPQDHEYIELFNADIALAQDILQTQQRKGTTLTQRVYQAIGYDDGAFDILEPYIDCVWNLSFYNNSFAMIAADSSKEVKRTDHRCVSHLNTCFYWRNGAITGYMATPAWEHGDPNTIFNDVKKPFDIDKDGVLSYVKIEKATETFDAGIPTEYGWNVNLHVKDQAITQNVMAIRPVQYTDHLAIVGDYPTPPSWCWADVRLMPISYSVLHSNIGASFQCVIYEKHELIDDGLIPLNYKAYVAKWSPPDFYRVAERWHRERVTYWIYVNGKHYQIVTGTVELPVEVGHVQKHRQFLVTPTEADPAYPNIINSHAACFGNHVLDVETAGEQVARIFTSVTAEILLVGFDIYPVELHHDIVRENYVGFDGGGLLFNYTGSPYAYPPLIDSTFTAPNSRKWMLFNLAGNYQSIPAPTTNRVNGMGLMLVESEAPPTGATQLR